LEEDYSSRSRGIKGKNEIVSREKRENVKEGTRAKGERDIGGGGGG